MANEKNVTGRFYINQFTSGDYSKDIYRFQADEIPERTRPLVPGCGLDSPESLSSFLEGILDNPFVGDSGTTYRVSQLTNGHCDRDLLLHKSCRELTPTEIQRLSSRVRSVLI